MIPLMLAKNAGVKGAVDFVRDIRSLPWRLYNDEILIVLLLSNDVVVWKDKEYFLRWWLKVYGKIISERALFILSCSALGST